ncbi:MAG TPA: hypothetical protein DDZ51_08155 [Planctomycetaceae bacterium]|nr:hypothetical protein [Planctomycetaceae bacterium]
MLALGAAFCSVVPAYADTTGHSSFANPSVGSEASPQYNASPAYAPITLRGPSTSLSSATAEGTAQAPALDSNATQRADTANQKPGDLAEGSSVRRSMATPLVTIASSLALVLGLFAALVWVSRKAQRGQGVARTVPDEVLRVLGRKHMGSLGTISIVRCGRTVMIVSQSASGIQSLATITDEAEVRHLEAACLGESSASFQATLGEIEREPAGRGFLGDGIAQPNARKKLFTQA